MESAALWLSFVAAAAAVAAAVFAYVEARAATDARRVAKEAEASALAARDAAVEAQKETAANSGRIAAALEEQTASARAAAQTRSDPWEMRPGRPRKTGSAILLVHTGPVPLVDVSIDIERRPYAVSIDPDPVPERFETGDAVEIYYMRAGGDHSTSTIVVHWRWADEDEMHTTRGTLN